MQNAAANTTWQLAILIEMIAFNKIDKTGYFIKSRKFTLHNSIIYILLYSLFLEMEVDL